MTITSKLDSFKSVHLDWVTNETRSYLDNSRFDYVMLLHSLYLEVEEANDNFMLLPPASQKAFLSEYILFMIPSCSLSEMGFIEWACSILQCIELKASIETENIIWKSIFI